MATPIERANLLASLHIKGDPLIFFNIWDAGSAKALQETGAKAIATGSWSVAAAHGYSDGEELPFEVVLSNLLEIVASVDLPVSLDMESGYGRTPAQLHETITKVIEAGAVGINFEDQIIGEDGLYSIEEQAARVKAVRQAAGAAGVPLFINARTDIFLKNSTHTDAHLDEAIQRAAAYAEAGGSGFFAPGLWDAKQIEKLCQQVALPVNIMMFSSVPSTKDLASMGVARISYGPNPYRQMIANLKEGAKKAFSRE